ncbi:prepilin peptidase [Phycicoccus sonneratiae]|uniref:Prepilin peptidase n=1 Tax=Phycicoccus sonneratiae TaxID=2807628 RepID=A0ABS2CIW7_9MICO|nr:A24 family peptidase [Phycicoccus sonneraticus]MBM6399418.1 prepilin peptidase [Phycicoccus sonneraticus]
MTPWWVVLAGALVLGVVGHLTGRELATGGYRIEEDEAEHPPGNPWWTGPATGALAGVAAWSVQDLGGWAALPPFLLFAWLTVALVWIDLDVHRLPVGLVVPGGAALLVLVALAVLATGGPRWQGTLIGAALMGGFYLVLFLLPGGGVGFGDVRLAPVIGALLGFLGTTHVVIGMCAGFLVGGLAAVAMLVLRRVGLSSHIAYGPAMCLGAWFSIAFTPRIVIALGGG